MALHRFIHSRVSIEEYGHVAVYQCYALRSSVGASTGPSLGLMNLPDDVRAVQTLLNEHTAQGGYPSLLVTGSINATTIAAIRTFQQKIGGMPMPSGRVDPGSATLQQLNQTATLLPARPTFTGVFSHPGAEKVSLSYGEHAVRLNAKAEYLLKSILASVGIKSAELTSTLRTYHDQARITLTQTYVAAGGPGKVATWYGNAVLEAVKKHKGDVEGLAAWWEKYDKDRGKVSSRHLSNRALDVKPVVDRVKFADKVASLVGVAGTGVTRIIRKGELGEPVDHVEFGFDVTG